MESNCSHTYSKSMNEPRPRLCTKCVELEICKACQTNVRLHMCGKKNGLDNKKLIYTELDMHYAVSYAVAHPEITASEMKEKVESVMSWVHVNSEKMNKHTTNIVLERWDDLPNRYHAKFKLEGKTISVLNIAKVISNNDLSKCKFDYNELTGDLNCFLDNNDGLSKETFILTWIEQND